MVLCALILGKGFVLCPPSEDTGIAAGEQMETNVKSLQGRESIIHFRRSEIGRAMESAE